MSNSIISVAIADDHKLYLEALAGVVNNHPRCRVTIKAGDGKDLLDQLSVSLSPDIILLDISMPVMDGFETMAILRKRMPGTKVLALSGYNSGLAISQMRQLGAHGFFSKRAEPAEITEALNSVLQKGSYYPGYDSLFPFDDTAPASVEKIQGLSNKEMTFLRYACADLSYKQIAVKMNVSRYTIDDYRNALFAKFDVQTRAALILMAVKYKMVEPAVFMPGE